TDGEKNTIRQLTRLQRRVLGTLVEKAFTTPDQYPMTVKGLIRSREGLFHQCPQHPPLQPSQLSNRILFPVRHLTTP
ncbi:MAG: DUF480 domain-containing protein, partial [Planctomycetaceae bacterium]